MDDNGHGFNFAGTYSLEELELLRLGPASLKRRARSLNADLHAGIAARARRRAQVPHSAAMKNDWPQMNADGADENQISSAFICVDLRLMLACACYRVRLRRFHPSAAAGGDPKLTFRVRRSARSRCIGRGEAFSDVLNPRWFAMAAGFRISIRSSTATPGTPCSPVPPTASTGSKHGVVLSPEPADLGRHLHRRQRIGASVMAARSGIGMWPGPGTRCAHRPGRAYAWRRSRAVLDPART